ncbi:MAG: elongation factor 1-beta [Candidatus Odinarchaeum yellowstonii]|uniref:Elongation factor 1-beta n=1 Tax=Odinarchaeota yellowstonii (strain LCB_4) TaxID=1841599 RepID=A0AAF0I9H8_ODILC|nr:MAG: elongation factor 1-beta [Candidatus Odinarchaeum yellowstonii]
MGKVLTVLNIIPQDQDVNLNRLCEKIKSSLPKNIKYHDSKIEPLAFGVNTLKISFILDDSEGGMNILEDLIKNIEGVGEISVEHLTLI